MFFYILQDFYIYTQTIPKDFSNDVLTNIKKYRGADIAPQ